jgi:hypothetical protein
VIDPVVVGQVVVVDSSSSYLRGQVVGGYCEVQVFGRGRLHFLSGYLSGHWAEVVDGMTNVVPEVQVE